MDWEFFPKRILEIFQSISIAMTNLTCNYYQFHYFHVYVDVSLVFFSLSTKVSQFTDISLYAFSKNIYTPYETHHLKFAPTHIPRIKTYIHLALKSSQIINSHQFRCSCFVRPDDIYQPSQLRSFRDTRCKHYNGRSNPMLYSYKYQQGSCFYKQYTVCLSSLWILITLGSQILESWCDCLCF